VNKRSGETGRRGQPVSPTTIKKELSSFSRVWNWGIRMNKTKAAYPNKGLRYAKTADKPPFQTWEEIERQIACGGMSEVEQAELWDCLFIRIEEIGELLCFVERLRAEPFLYPMVLVAAHTGARRSEIARSQKRDFDFKAGTPIMSSRP
jgi:integrase